MATNKQLAVREAFKKCTRCFANQPDTGGVTPPTYGPRSREWWYNNNDGQWYYNNFIQDSMPYFLDGDEPPWCRSGAIPIPIHYYVDAHSPTSNFGNTTFLYTGAWLYGGGSTPYPRRGFLSLDISAITKEDGANSNALVLLFAYKNSIHPIDPPLPPAIEQGFYYIPVSGQLPTRSWNTQYGMSSPKKDFRLHTTTNSIDLLTAVRLTEKYKDLIEDEETHFNIGVRADNESGSNYPYGPMTIYNHAIAGDGMDMLAYLSFS